ncbi:unnamed protein product [Meloidogyne enterolobii]|uniref:Uncharacterized protein n=1 Tax=Meloidogyne enterolobii TaxID=390850 RepID=A0ACB1A6N5_MELEN
MRTGDFINACVLADKSPISSKKQKQLILAIYSYSLACEYAFKGLELGDDVDQNLNAVLSLYTLELVVLIRKNCVDENSLLFCNNFMLGSFVFNYTQTFINLPKGNRENESFIFCDQTTILRRSNEYFEGEACLKRAFLLSENIYFLRRFVWLLEEFDEFKEGIYPFIDDLFNSIPEFPQDAFNACSPESISRADIKIFLFRLSQHLKCEFNIEFTLPWIFYKKCNLNHQQFWSFVKCVNNEGIANINLSILIQITTALEQIRDPNIEQIFSDDLINTINFIKKLGEENNFLKIILERYSNLLKMFMPENDWIFVVDNENNKIEAKEREEEEEGNLIEREVVAVDKLEEEINKIIEEEKNLNKKVEGKFKFFCCYCSQGAGGHFTVPKINRFQLLKFWWFLELIPILVSFLLYEKKSGDNGAGLMGETTQVPEGPFTIPKINRFSLKILWWFLEMIPKTGKPEKQLLSISTQTDYQQPPQQQQNIQQQINQQQQQLNKQIKIIQDWGETNFNINRWICHNAMLYKIFNRR